MNFGEHSQTIAMILGIICEYWLIWGKERVEISANI